MVGTAGWLNHKDFSPLLLKERPERTGGILA